MSKINYIESVSEVDVIENTNQTRQNQYVIGETVASVIELKDRMEKSSDRISSELREVGEQVLSAVEKTQQDLRDHMDEEILSNDKLKDTIVDSFYERVGTDVEEATKLFSDAKTAIDFLNKIARVIAPIIAICTAILSIWIGVKWLAKNVSEFL